MDLFPVEVRANIALILAILAAALGAANAWRDRAILVATCKHVKSISGGPGSIYVHIVNVGRRTTRVRMLAGSDNQGVWSGEYLDDDVSGLELTEHKMYETYLRRDDLYKFLPDGEIIVSADLWFEDTLKRRHKVKGARASIAALLAEPEIKPTVVFSKMPMRFVDRQSAKLNANLTGRVDL
ncbi:hypothetical protein GJ699_28405 [Duganella sp. FT80W]|uniref:Uncharacterized protein n=1 Tax=Duganella guangzhouensis TaxID=2666084 RepID=A0A6I2LCD8_9BURK|nr:hypothetical protein [Duganella guangzhouensis]MRW93919.1 hypothetical protein [Duganella guangzhouensis]